MTKGRDWDSLTQQELRRLFHYDPETGVILNRVTRKRSLAGDVAGHAHTTNSGNTYRVISIEGYGYTAHRLVWMYMTGEWPRVIDHIDGNGLNNQWVNLRSVEQKENARNSRRSSSNKSGYTGVDWDKRKSRWRAQICFNGKVFFLGYFLKIEDAVAVRKAKERELGFHPNHGSDRERKPRVLRRSWAKMKPENLTAA